jgi:hypothetical protein
MSESSSAVHLSGKYSISKGLNQRQLEAERTLLQHSLPLFAGLFIQLIN